MAHWTVVRMERVADETAGLTCMEGEYPMKVTLKDTDTGTINTVQLCAPLGNTDPCAVLDILTVNYPANDWTGECP